MQNRGTRRKHLHLGDRLANGRIKRDKNFKTYGEPIKKLKKIEKNEKKMKKRGGSSIP